MIQKICLALFSISPAQFCDMVTSANRELLNRSITASLREIQTGDRFLIQKLIVIVYSDWHASVCGRQHGGILQKQVFDVQIW